MFHPRRYLPWIVTLTLIAVVVGDAVPAGAGEPRKLQGHDKTIAALSFSPDGNTLATAGLDGKMCLWKVAEGKIAFRIEADKNAVYAVAFAPDGKLLATAGTEHAVKLWDPASGKEIRQLKGHQDQVAALAFSPDGKLLATGSYDKSIRLWNTANWQEVRQLKGSDGRITALAFAPDGKTLLSGGTALASLTIGRGNIVETGQADALRLWDVTTGKTAEPKLSSAGSQVAFSSDGRMIAGGGLVTDIQTDQRGSSVNGLEIISLVNPVTGQTIRQIKSRGSAVLFSPDGKTLVSAGEAFLHIADFGLILSNTDHRIRLWDVAAGQEALRLWQSDATAIAFSPDGKILAVGSGDGLVRLWDIEAEKANPTPDPQDMIKRGVYGRGVGVAGANPTRDPQNMIKRHLAEDKLVNRLDAVVGTWEKVADSLRITLQIGTGQLRMWVVSEKDRKQQLAMVDAEYSMTKDGILYGIVSSIEMAEATEPVPASRIHEPMLSADTLFSFRFRLDDEVLTIKDVRFCDKSSWLSGRFKRQARGCRPGCQGRSGSRSAI